ncbi:AIPR family protein [Acidithiobacillus ferrivorans]|nr:AIPR family protein [Acidithiobacillus ferrivorans]
MDNIILTGMLKDFSMRHELTAENVEQQFEKFANYCLLNADHYDSFEFDKVATGNCLGVDGVAVSIGGVIVDELEDAKLFTKAQFDAKFIFAQAKTSSNFDVGDFLKFSATVKVFFGRDIAAVPPELHKAFKIKDVIYGRSAKLRQLPTVELSYVYSGRYGLKDTQIEKQIETEIQALRDMPYLFSKVTWHVYDGDAISRLYRETQNDVQKQVSFQRHVALPPIRGTLAAYIGVVSCKDYVRIVQKENGELNKGLFFDNVRDFLGGDNPVNEQIAKTINNTGERDRFAILNNGVTIVAKNVTPSGDNFMLSQFQVVNGCQTSHVLFKNRETLTDDMFITVKLIVTSDIDLTGKVVATTNSQSLVTKEAFATIRPYHRDLEDFFNAMRSSGFEYYYERRPHQYDEQDDILQHTIISAPSLIKSFVSVALDAPHKVHYYYGRLLNEYNSKDSSELFAEDDYPGLYFAAHHISARTRMRTLATKKFDLKGWNFHLALLIKKQLAPGLQKRAALNDKKFHETLERIDQNFDQAYDIAANIVTQSNLSINDNRIPGVTAQLLGELAKSNIKPTAKPRASASLANSVSLTDGNYVGQVEFVDYSTQKIDIKYGPYTIKGIAANAEALALKQGDRASFTIKNKTVIVSDLSLTP